MTLNNILTAALAQLDRGHDAQTLENYRVRLTQYANDASLQMHSGCSARIKSVLRQASLTQACCPAV